MIPRTARAVMLVEIGKLELQEIPTPEPGPGEVLLRVVRASVCNGSDAAVFSGRRVMSVAYPWMQLPWCMGHECAGQIVAAGPGVTDFEVGQRVASLNYGGAFADYQLVQKDLLIPVPDSLSFDQATFLELMFATNTYMPHIGKGDKVVVMGLGPSGILLLQQCLAVGAEAVLCADRHDLRLEIAAKLGATATVNTEHEDLEAATKELLGEADAFIDATGQDVYDIGIRLLRSGGKVIAYGVPDSGVHYDGTRAFFRGIRFLTKSSHYASPPRLASVFDRIEELIEEGCMDFDTLVTHHFPLEGAPEAVRMAIEEPGRVLGMVIDVG